MSSLKPIIRPGEAAFAAAVLAGGILYSFSLDGALRYPDERSYQALAHNLATLGEYTLDGDAPTALLPPGYPLLLACLQVLGLGTVASRLLNFALLAATILVIHRILARLHSDKAGVYGAALIVLYPVLFYTAGTLYPQTLATFLFASIVLALEGIHASPTASPRAALTVGILFGWLVLSVPSFVFALGVVVCWLTVPPSKARPAAAAIIFLTSATIVAGWSARHRVAMGAWVFVSTNSGINLLLGNSPGTHPGSGVNADLRADLAAARGMDEVSRDRFFRSRAINNILAEPAWALRLYALKVLHHFNYRNQLATTSERSPAREALMLFTYGPLLCLFVVRLLYWRRWPLSHVELLLAILYVGNAFFSALFFTRIRFRLPYDIIPVIFSAMILTRWGHGAITGDPAQTRSPTPSTGPTRVSITASRPVTGSK